MGEAVRIAKLFTDLYNGQPWLDVTLDGTLGNIKATDAAKKLLPQANSIWQIVHHIISWRSNMLQRVQGKVIITPDHNYFEEIIDQSEAALQHTLQRLQQTNSQWNELLTNMQDDQLSIIYPRNNATYYENIHGLLQHDAYNLGQLVLLIKLL